MAPFSSTYKAERNNLSCSIIWVRRDLKREQAIDSSIPTLGPRKIDDFESVCLTEGGRSHGSAHTPEVSRARSHGDKIVQKSDFTYSQSFTIGSYLGSTETLICFL